MRTHMTPITFRETPLIDTCGTGGSHPNRFNVSLVLLWFLGVWGIMSPNMAIVDQKSDGSFDFLEALEIPLKDPHTRIKHNSAPMGQPSCLPGIITCGPTCGRRSISIKNSKHI